ncbi:putative RNA polymerase II subunit B1 CTD phosphatase RPAP2 homolog isoform X2 [Punica granatum]|uniref:RNA polymerase II subunit B1 CTD phosphatase RPAP2 homolog n=1 Tax=Punica granatum TaxID=22663 RepID=A0A6P8EA81_PUNGR|nr:putative RNA polymerase II subunit B1 CTD phosphatase RPAP2 homolog isoform X2 [Punica granatum]
MANKAEASVSVKDAVYRLQNILLDGITAEAQLFAAGSIMSRGDYEDVVTERSITNLCGYPLCPNPLPSDRPQKGRYRISLKEHKVYDLHETYMYCSSGCVVNSRTFAGTLQDERCSVLNPAKLDEVLRLFDGSSLGRKEEEDDGDFGLSKLKIQEKEEVKSGEVTTEQWAGPSNAIEGYVPQKERKPAPRRSKAQKEGPKPSKAKVDKTNLIINDFDFVNTCITPDEYSVSKLPPSSVGTASSSKLNESKEEGSQVDSRDQSAQKHRISNEKSVEFREKSKCISTADAPSTSNACPPCYVEPIGELGDDVEIVYGKLSSNGLKSSLKSVGAKKANRSVTWADEKETKTRNRNLSDVREMEDTEAGPVMSDDEGIEDEGHLLQFSSAEACAMALNQAAEAVASGKSDVLDAVSDAGLIILPPAHDEEEDESAEDPETVEVDLAAVKWPRKPNIPTSDLFDSEDSWFDAPPEGFSLTLSPFASMWGAPFSWMVALLKSSKPLRAVLLGLCLDWLLISGSLYQYPLWSKHWNLISDRGACWIPCHLSMLSPHSELNNGKWFFFYSLMLSPFPVFLHLLRT